MDAFAVAHPSLLKVPKDMQTIQKPGLFLLAEVDSMFTDSMRKEAEEVLKTRDIRATFKVYPGTQHGFAVRGSEHKELVKEARRDALSQAIQFFKAELTSLHSTL